VSRHVPRHRAESPPDRQGLGQRHHEAGHLGGEFGHLGGAPTQSSITCTRCQRALPQTDFDPIRLFGWREHHNVIRDAVCDACWPEKRGRMKGHTFTCGGQCQLRRPAADFNSAEVERLLRADEMWRLQCVVCSGEATSQAGRELFGCGRCEVQKPLTEFTPAVSKLKYDKTKWRCRACQYPACQQCSARPSAAINQQYEDESYFCKACSWPPCAGGCGAPRPGSSKYNKRAMPTWHCARCRLP
jgi:hypothetical protein